MSNGATFWTGWLAGFVIGNITGAFGLVTYAMWKFKRRKHGRDND